MLQKRKVLSMDVKDTVLVPTDLKKIQTILSRSWDEEYLISYALKHQLTDNSVVNNQQICSALVNTTLQKLTKINPFYSNIIIHNESEHLCEQSDPVLWKLLTRMPESLITEIRLIVMMI